MFLVETGTPGFVRVRNIPVMGPPGEGYASHAEVRFTGCRVPLSQRLGESGSGFMLAQERLGPGPHPPLHALDRRVRARLRSDVRARRGPQDRRREPLADKQLVAGVDRRVARRDRLVRLLVLRTAWRIDQVEQQAHADSGGHGFHALQEDVSLIKFHVAGVLGRVVDRAVQVHGALGLTGDTVLSYFYATSAPPASTTAPMRCTSSPPPAASSSATRRAPEIRARNPPQKARPKSCRHAAPAAFVKAALRLHARNCSRPRRRAKWTGSLEFPGERGDGKTLPKGAKGPPDKTAQISSFQRVQGRWCGMV